MEVMAEFNNNMDFPELDAYFSKNKNVEDESEALASLLKRGAMAYREAEDIRKQCLNARELLPKEYRYIEFTDLPRMIEKCKTFDLKSYSREFTKCLIIGTCFYILFQSIISSVAVFVVCLIVLIGGGYMTDRKNSEKLEAYYSLLKQLRGVFPELELEVDYCCEEKLMSLYNIVQSNKLTSLKSAVEKLETIN